jgi:hypothetical protein
MNFDKLCFWLMFTLFFINCFLAARYGVLPFLAVLVGIPLACAWYLYLKPVEPIQQLQRIKFGNQYLLVEA